MLEYIHGDIKCILERVNRRRAFSHTSERSIPVYGVEDFKSGISLITWDRLRRSRFKTSQHNMKLCKLLFFESALHSLMELSPS
jgi:hypothetical protein